MLCELFANAGYLLCIQDEQLPSYLGIVISHYADSDTD